MNSSILYIQMTQYTEEQRARRRQAKLKYAKTEKGKACARSYYQRTKAQRQQKMLEWRTKQKERMDYLERFHEAYMNAVTLPGHTPSSQI